jgi:hypothetical protein
MQKLVFILIAFIAAVTFIRAFDHTGLENKGVSLDAPTELSETNLPLDILN